MSFSAETLQIRGRYPKESGLLVEVTPNIVAGPWEFIHFQAWRLAPGGRRIFETGMAEFVLVMLSGVVAVHTNHGHWPHVGNRTSVFGGLPHALYLPPETTIEIHARTLSEFGVAWVPTDERHPPRLITPKDVRVEIRGGGNITRQINDIIPPAFECHRLVVVEVYTPGGNWSSYPPHKHDRHKVTPDGHLLEADLEEIYFYKFDHPDGYAYQRVYTDADSPLHQAGQPIDALMRVGENDIILVPEGYHPVVSAPGYTTYYLNILAGSAQSLANSDDPRYAWVKEHYGPPDPRVPIYPLPRWEA